MKTIKIKCPCCDGRDTKVLRSNVLHKDLSKKYLVCGDCGTNFVAHIEVVDYKKPYPNDNDKDDLCPQPN